MKIDLHSHTSFSDGALEPEALIDLARAQGVDVLAVTDHDTVESFERARPRAEALGLRLVPGIELACSARDAEVHLLGYGFDPDDPALRRRLAELAQARRDRVAKVCKLLRAQGVDLAAEEVYRRSGGRTPTREHIALALLDGGHVRSRNQAYRRYLSHRGSAYVPPTELSAGEAVKLLADAGGVAVVAHPGIHEDDDLLPSLAADGVRGLEVFHPYPDPSLVERYAALAERYRLIPTGGSDFHGEPLGPTHALPGTFTCPAQSLRRLEAEWRTRWKIATS